MALGGSVLVLRQVVLCEMSQGGRGRRTVEQLLHLSVLGVVGVDLMAAGVWYHPRASANIEQNARVLYFPVYKLHFFIGVANTLV